MNSRKEIKGYIEKLNEYIISEYPLYLRGEFEGLDAEKLAEASVRVLEKKNRVTYGDVSISPRTLSVSKEDLIEEVKLMKKTGVL